MPYLDRVTQGEPLIRGDYRIEPYTTGAAVYRGDFVKFSSGTVVQALSKVSGTVNTVTTSTGSPVVCVGICLHDAASGETVQVAIADDQSEFFGRILHATGSSAEQQDITVGSSYNLGIYYVATDFGQYGVSTVSSSPDVIVTEKSPESAAGDNFGFVWFKFKNAYRALSV